MRSRSGWERLRKTVMDRKSPLSRGGAHPLLIPVLDIAPKEIFVHWRTLNRAWKFPAVAPRAHAALANVGIGLSVQRCNGRYRFAPNTPAAAQQQAKSQHRLAGVANSFGSPLIPTAPAPIPHQRATCGKAKTERRRRRAWRQTRRSIRCGSWVLLLRFPAAAREIERCCGSFLHHRRIEPMRAVAGLVSADESD